MKNLDRHIKEWNLLFTDTVDSLNLFYDVMLCNRKIRNETEKEEVEASYFAMCLLLPRESFLEAINYLGGIDECYKINNIKALSRLFRVEDKLVRVRLKDLSSILESEEQTNTENLDEAQKVGAIYRLINKKRHKKIIE